MLNQAPALRQAVRAVPGHRQFRLEPWVMLLPASCALARLLQLDNCFEAAVDESLAVERHVSHQMPTGTRLAKHTFVGDKGDYYDINDGAKQSDSY